MNATYPDVSFSRDGRSTTAYIDGPEHRSAGFDMKFRYYLQSVGDVKLAGLVASASILFPENPKRVWQVFKDFNSWQNESNHFYSDVLGDIPGQDFRLSSAPNDGGPRQYRVETAIPEHLLCIRQPGPWDGGPQPHDGSGTYMLCRSGSGCVLSITMRHAIMVDGQTDDEALNYWRAMEPALMGKWTDDFVPALRRLASAGEIGAR